MNDIEFAGTLPVREEIREVFNALVSGAYTNFALVSVTFNGWPTEAIVTVNGDEEDTEMAVITPLAVFLSEEMKDSLLSPFGDPLSDREI